MACFLLIPKVILRKSPKVDWLDADHLKRAETVLVMYLQATYYECKMSALSQVTGTAVNTNSSQAQHIRINLFL